MSQQLQDLSPLLQWRPWPPGDPAPEIWRIIFELDRRVQIQVVERVLDTQVAVLQAHVKGLQGLKQVLAEAGKG
ncbi:MAG: hypothetical protein ACJ74L_09430 [Gaiellaceae bacterium]|jgi:hypothetical protein